MQCLNQLAINESGFTFDPRTGESYRLNETAVYLIKILRTGISEQEAAEKLAATFQISIAEAWEDVLEFITSLKQFGVLTPEGALDA